MDNSNKMVRVSYVGTFDDGHVFIDQTDPRSSFPASTDGCRPHSSEAIALDGNRETRSVRVSADEAYEERSDERIIEIPRGKIPSDLKLPVGEMVNLEDPIGQTFPARVIEVTDEKACSTRTTTPSRKRSTSPSPCSR